MAISEGMSYYAGPLSVCTTSGWTHKCDVHIKNMCKYVSNRDYMSLRSVLSYLLERPIKTWLLNVLKKRVSSGFYTAISGKIKKTFYISIILYFIAQI